jgi:hypothetical protein
MWRGGDYYDEANNPVFDERAGQLLPAGSSCQQCLGRAIRPGKVLQW